MLNIRYYFSQKNNANKLSILVYCSEIMTPVDKDNLKSDVDLNKIQVKSNEHYLKN